MYYRVNETIKTDGKAEYTVTECEGNMPRTSTARIEGGRSVIDRYFLSKEEAQNYADIYNSAEQGDLEPLLAKSNEGLEGRIGKSKLKIAREATGLSQAQLSERTGIAKKSLQFYEQRLRQLSKIDTVLKICVALNCRIEDIVEDPETLELLEKYKSKG